MTATYYLSLTGKTLKLRRIEHDSPAGVAPSKGKIIGFSQASRRRLLCYLNSVDWAKSDPTMFVTLTYPDSVPISKMSYRRNHRNAWVKSVERLLGRRLGIVWRQEWVRRKMGKYAGHLRPHYHLLVFGVHFLSKEDVKACWARAVNFDEPRLQVDVKQVVGQDGAIRYVAKYVAKNPYLDIGLYLDTGFQLGRFWGVVHPEEIPMHPTIDSEVPTWATLCDVVADASGILKVDPLNLLGGFTIFGDQAMELFDKYKNKA